MRNKRSAWILVILLLTGALIGGVGGELLSHNSYLAWLNLGGKRDLFAYALQPAIDFRVFKFGFNIALRINVGSIIGMLLGLLLYYKK